MRYDVAVIGGGPAGMMAAGRAAELGCRVVLIEKNSRLGMKLLMTGKGRCNITNYEMDLKKLVEQYGREGKFLYSVFSKFSVKDTLDFFHCQGLPTKVERGKRVFPKSERAIDVLQVLLEYLKNGGVSVVLKTGVEKLEQSNKKIVRIKTSEVNVEADKIIVCTGGMSYPKSGSDGGGYKLVGELGHAIVELKPALCALILQEKWIQELEGASLKNVEISVYQNGRKKDSHFGEALFTGNGISGPIVLDMSKHVGELLEQGKVLLKIDFKPALEFNVLDKRLQRDFQKFQNRDFKNSLKKLLPQKLIPVFIELSGIDPNKKVNIITKDERKKIAHLLKGLEVRVKCLSGFDNAIITSGGVALNEIDPQTMKSKIIDNLYFAGEIINLDGPTGGYNLQICWSTGYVSGM